MNARWRTQFAPTDRLIFIAPTEFLYKNLSPVNGIQNPFSVKRDDGRPCKIGLFSTHGSQNHSSCIGYNERHFHDSFTEMCSYLTAVYERNDQSLCLISEILLLIAAAVMQSILIPIAFWIAAVIRIVLKTSPYIFPISETNYWNALPQSAQNAQRSSAQTFTWITSPSIGAFIRSVLPCISRSPRRSALAWAEHRRPKASPSLKKR